MKKLNLKRPAIVLTAALSSFGAMQIASAAPTATLIDQGQSAQVDGWNISVPTGVSLTVTTSGDEIFVEKAANFTSANEALDIGFAPVTGAGTAATSVDFTDETVQNNTGKAFTGFEFSLMNTGTANATFSSVSNVFTPPSGTGYNYSTVSLNKTSDILTYTGNQDAGSTSSWGSATTGDNLLIDAPAGSDFSLRELASSSGGGGGGSTVPLPAAAWQSLATLGALGLIAIGRRAKRLA